MKKEYPSDIITVEGINYKEKAKTEGDPYAVERYVDEWGCIFENVHKGIIGEVKEPIVQKRMRIGKIFPEFIYRKKC